MAEEEYIAATQETLGKLITKPKMTEKYLKKPPFRFLHDIVMEVTRATTFGQGLFSAEESDAAALADKQAKIDFLNKAISLVCFALGEKVDVSANKIVAGLDADKTNTWLQKLHQAATTCVGAKSEDAVGRVLGGESVAAPKKEKKKKEEPAEGAVPAPPAEDGGGAAAEDEAAAKAAEDKKRREARKKKEAEKKAKEEAEAAAAAAAAEGAPAAGDAQAEEEERLRKEKEAKEAKRQERKKREAEEKERKRQEEEAEQIAQAQAAAQAEAAAMHAAQAAQLAAAHAAEAEQFAEADEVMPSAPGSAIPGARVHQDDGGASPDEIAARAQQLMAQQQAEAAAAGGDAFPGSGEGQEQLRPERPRTAGRRPPKVQSKVKESSEQTAQAAVAAPVIFGDGKDNAEDDDTFETPAQDNNLGANLGGDDPIATQGKLVRELMEQKKKEEEQARLRKEEEETREEFDDQQGKGIKMGKLKRKKGEAQAQQEVDIGDLAQAIQNLCQAANPLGKSIDLVHQDIANMGKEHDQWKNEYREARESYQNQLKMTDDMLQPLYQKVAELDDKIAEHKTKIQASRSRISKNDLKIQSLLESVVCAK